MTEPLVSVVIITRNRPQMLRDCLEHLLRQDYEPFEAIVVDSSSNEQSQAVLDDFPAVRRLRIPGGKNNMPQARNLGIKHASGEIIAFIDDDSMVREGWLRHLVDGYSLPDVGGVGGRVVDEYEDTRVNLQDQRIGLVRDNGLLVANFGLDPGCQVEVDHFRGCNMSFRKVALDTLGGFDCNYTGGNTLEETDMCVRVKHAGYTLLFEPQAVVDHLSTRWQQFQKRGPGLVELFHGTKNYAYFFFKNFGIRPRVLKHIFGRVLLHRLRTLLSEPSLWNIESMVVALPGSFVGLATSLAQCRSRA